MSETKAISDISTYAFPFEATIKRREKNGSRGVGGEEQGEEHGGQ